MRDISSFKAGIAKELSSPITDEVVLRTLVRTTEAIGDGHTDFNQLLHFDIAHKLRKAGIRHPGKLAGIVAQKRRIKSCRSANRGW